MQTTITLTAEISDIEITFLTIHVNITAKDLRRNPLSTCAHTSIQQRLPNIHTSPPATLQASVKTLSKVKP